MIENYLKSKIEGNINIRGDLVHKKHKKGQMPAWGWALIIIGILFLSSAIIPISFISKKEPTLNLLNENISISCYSAFDVGATILNPTQKPKSLDITIDYDNGSFSVSEEQKRITVFVGQELDVNFNLRFARCNRNTITNYTIFLMENNNVLDAKNGTIRIT